jgi:hypothetical protein
MEYQENDAQKPIEVDVYDFLHNLETLDTLALCWVPQGEYWLTSPIYNLSPINNKKPLLE